MTIAHISDLHFGRIAHPGIVQALVDEINSGSVDLVAVSGDLTQRARKMQFQAAAAMLANLKAPVLVVPGNHDVYAWWYPVGRLFRPLRRYRRFISGDLFPRHEANGTAVLGINSAHGRTIKGGRIGLRERVTLRNYFQNKPATTFKVLVVHHHLTRIQALGPHDVARKAEKTVEVASEVGVDLILCGHLHVSHIEPIDIVPARHRLVIASAGTATSSRSRSTGKTNFYNVITVNDTDFTIEERRFDPDAGGFIRDGIAQFERSFE